MKAKDLRFGTLNPISENTSTHGGDRRRTTTVTSINRALDKAYEKDTLLGVNEFNGIVVFSRLKTYPTYKNRSSLLQEYTIAADADGLAGARPAGHDGGDEEEEEAELVTQEYDNIAYKVYIPELDPRPAPDGTDCTLLRAYSDVYSDIKTEIPLGSIVVVRYEDKENLFNPRIVRVMEGPIRIDGVSWDPAEQKPLEHSFINGNTTSTVGSATIPGAKSQERTLSGDGPRYPSSDFRPTYNWTKADRTKSDIKFVVMHTTEISTTEASVRVLNGYDERKGKFMERRVSAHYVVSPDGQIINMISDKDIAWHAGVSSMNKASIGIEVVGYSKDINTWGNNKQGLAKLIKYLSDTYGIPLIYEGLLPGTYEGAAAPSGTGLQTSIASGFIAHGKVTPGRRYDPGVHFPWEELVALAGGTTEALT